MDRTFANLFDCDVKHMPGKSHTAADALLKRSPTDDNIRKIKTEPNLKNVLDAELDCLDVAPISIDQLHVLEAGFSKKSIQIATYLTTLHPSDKMSIKKFKKFKAEALRYKVVNHILFRRNTKNIPLKRVIDNPEKQTNIIAALHDDSEHKKRESTYSKIADKY